MGGCIEDQSRGPIEDAGTGSGHGIWRGRRGFAAAPAASMSFNGQPILSGIMTSNPK